MSGSGKYLYLLWKWRKPKYDGERNQSDSELLSAIPNQRLSRCKHLDRYTGLNTNFPYKIIAIPINSLSPMSHKSTCRIIVKSGPLQILTWRKPSATSLSLLNRHSRKKQWRPRKKRRCIGKMLAFMMDEERLPLAARSISNVMALATLWFHVVVNQDNTCCVN